MLDLERQLHEYAEFLHSDVTTVPAGVLMERGTALRRVPPMRRMALVFGTAILILVIIGAVVLLAPFQGDDRPVIAPVTTTVPAPTTSLAPTTTAPTTTTTAVPLPLITWTRVDDPVLAESGYQEVGSVLIAGDAIYMSGHDVAPDGAATGAIWRSSDGGLTWERVADPEGVFDGVGNISITSLATDGHSFVAVGSEWSYSESVGRPPVWVSSDGTTWERVPVGNEAAIEGQAIARMATVVTTNSGFIAAGDQIWASPDGRTWTRVADLSAHGDRIFELLATDDMVIAVGQSFAGTSDAVVWWSTDGTNWTRISGREFAPDGKNSFLYGAANTPYGLVAVGGEGDDPGISPTGGLAASNAAAWWSTDGLRWRPLSHDAKSLGGGRGQYMNDVVAYDDLLVAVGIEMGTDWQRASGVVWQSTDGGATWTRFADPDAIFGAYYAGWSQITDIVQYGDALIATGSVTGDAAVWIGTIEKKAKKP